MSGGSVAALADAVEAHLAGASERTVAG